MKAFPPPGNGGHNRLPARMDVDVLDRHLLLTLAAMAVQGLQERREAARRFSAIHLVVGVIRNDSEAPALAAR